MQIAVEVHHATVGRSRRSTHEMRPTSTGPDPIVTSVPSATPARATPAKNASWYSAVMSPAVNPQRVRHRPIAVRRLPPIHGRRVMSPPPPMTSRAAPIDTGLAAGGANDAVVPVVPNSTAAPRTSRTARRRDAVGSGIRGMVRGRSGGVKPAGRSARGARAPAPPPPPHPPPPPPPARAPGPDPPPAGRTPLPAPDAHRRAPVPASGPRELVDEHRHQARARRAERMTE